MHSNFKVLTGCRVPPDFEERWGHVLRGTESAVDKNRKVRGNQVHEEPFRFNWAGNNLSISRSTILEKFKRWDDFLPIPRSSSFTKCFTMNQPVDWLLSSSWWTWTSTTPSREGGTTCQKTELSTTCSNFWKQSIICIGTAFSIETSNQKTSWLWTTVSN